MKFSPLILLMLCCSCLLLSSCMDGYAPSPTPVDLYGSRGVFVVNEGNYLYGNSSLSYYDFETKTVINNIFFGANAIPLGDVAYSMYIHNGRGYIVVNNSACIHVVDANTLELKGTITGLVSPRQMLFVDDGKALVSDLYARAISLVDIDKMQVIETIATGKQTLPYYQHGSEAMIRVGAQVFVNSWSFDNKILTIDLNSKLIDDSIEVGVQPLSMVLDAEGMIWVLNDGGYPGNPFGYENPSLMRVNPATREVELILQFPSINVAVSNLAMNRSRDTLYYLSNDLYSISINSNGLPYKPLVERNARNIRSIATDPISGNILIADAKDFMSEGVVYIYSPLGSPIDTFEVGIIPGWFCFN